MSGTERRLGDEVGRHRTHHLDGWVVLQGFSSGMVYSCFVFLRSFAHIPVEGFQRRGGSGETLGVQEWVFIICPHSKGLAGARAEMLSWAVG